MKFNRIIASSFLAATVLMSCSSDDDSSTPDVEGGELNAEVQLLLSSIEADGGTPFDFQNPVLTFTEDQNVFIPSVLGIDYRIEGNGTTSGQPSVTLPMFRGVQGDGDAAYYVITEASDEDFAEQLGVIYAPRMADAGEAGSQRVEWIADTEEEGIMRLEFPGTVDFEFKRSLVPGAVGVAGTDAYGLLTFPPAESNPGAIADAAWSSYVILPSGVVINAQQVANSTGTHDRISVIDTGRDSQDNLDNPNLDPDSAAVALQLLDGWQDGEAYYYHIVTDTSADAPAAIEKGVFAPRLEFIETFGNFPGGAFLPFSPVVNGNPNGTAEGNFQGLNTAIDSDFQNQDPTNTFPIDPDDASLEYTPMWDAHLVEWVVQEIAIEDRPILTSFDDIRAEIAAGRLVSHRANTTGPNEGFNNLSSAGATINCPVITQPTAAIAQSDLRIGFNLTDGDGTRN